MTDPVLEKAKHKSKLAFKSGSGLAYPNDLFSERNNKGMKFTFYDYVKPEHDQLEKQNSLGSVSLPMPPQLAHQDQLAYNDFDGGIEYGVYQSGREGFDTAYDKLGNGQALTQEDLKNSFKSVGGFASAMGVSAINNIASKYVAIASAQTGKTLDPRVLSKFERVGFKTYSFSWVMIAKDEKESQRIRDITKQFRLHSHPTLNETATFFNYPSLVSFEYLPSELNKWLWKPNPCAITSVGVEHNISGPPKFFKGSNAPVETLLTVQLKEMLVDTRETLEDKFND